MGLMWKTRKKAKNCNFRKVMKLQREAQAPGTAGFIAGLHRYQCTKGTGLSAGKSSSCSSTRVMSSI